MFTLPEAVPATSQVTVWLSPTFHVSFAVCEITANGPEFPSTVTVMKSKSDCGNCPVPLVSDLSLTVKAKSKDLATVDTVSHEVLSTVTPGLVSVNSPDKTRDFTGIYLVGFVLGGLDLHTAPDVLVGPKVLLVVIPSSTCSHEYVNTSLSSKSVADPTSLKAVP